MLCIVFYLGIFDLLINGYFDIIGWVVKLVDKLIIGVVINEVKKLFFLLEEWVWIVEEEVLYFVEVVEIEVCLFDGLLMYFVEQVGVQFIVCGLWVVFDFEYEFQMVVMNQQLNDEIEIVFLMVDLCYQVIVLCFVKEIVVLGGDILFFVLVWIEVCFKECFV